MRTIYLLSAALFCTVAGSAAAQESPQAVDSPVLIETIPVNDPAPAAQENVPENQAAQLDDITVTAERRASSLQATPISMLVFNAEKLELRGIEGLAGLSLNVPNLTIEPFPTHNATLRIFIRGIGINDAQLTQDPAVSVYLDGVYIARSVGLALELADLERIEVLRGPQGTLYGRNTTGGAINLITKRPALGAFTMAHKLSFGNRSTGLGKSSINVPVGDSLALKLAVLGSMRDGYVENTGAGGDFGDRSEGALRLDAHWVPWDWLSADYGYEYTDMKYYNYMFQSVLRPQTNKGQAELFKPYAESQALFSAARLGQLAASAPFEQSGTRIAGHAVTLTAPIGGYEFKYIGAYRDLTDMEYADLGGGLGSSEYRLDSNAYDGPAAAAANGGPTPLVIPTVTQEQWSHELQATGALFNDSVEWVAGLFYFTEDAVEDRHRLNHQLSTRVDPQQLDAITGNLPPDQRAKAVTMFGPRLVNFVDLWWSTANKAQALFGQATWTPAILDERLHLTFGYRHSRDERRAVKFRISDTWIEGELNGQGTAMLLSSAEKFLDVPAFVEYRDDSFSYVAAFDVTPEFNLYAKSSQAYKSGGFNVRDPNQSAASEAAAGDTAYGFGFKEGFAPEYIQSYEAGVKSEWLERTLRINANVFNSRYRDMQINFLVPGTISDTKVRNAGKARIQGLELDTTWLPIPSLLLSADYAYLNAEVLEALNVDGTNDAHLYPFTSAPEQSFVTAADWTLTQLAGWGDLRAYLSYNYVAERQGIVITEERRGLTSIPAYGLFNTRLGLGPMRAAGGELDLALWGRNLADKKYPIIAIDQVPHTDRAVIWGEPVSYGLDLIYRFY